MFTDLNNFLNFDVKHNEPHGLVGICEQSAESSFLFHHFVSFLLKRSAVCLISFTQSFNHFNTVGNKIGCSLTAAAKDKQFSFIDGLKALGSVINLASNSADIKRGNGNSWIGGDGKLNIQELLHFIIGSLDNLKEDSGKVPCLIIDNLSVLTDLGCPVKDVIFLVHYLSSFCLDSQGSSMMVLGVCNDLRDEDEESSELWKYIQHCSALSLAVSGLDTGYCKEVHGQVGQL